MAFKEGSQRLFSNSKVEVTLDRLLKAKTTEHRLSPDLHEVSDGEQVQVGPFGVEFLAVNHSIPDAMAVAITTDAGRVLHTDMSV